MSDMFEKSVKERVVGNCNELIELLEVQDNDGWMFVQDNEVGSGWAIMAAKGTKELLSMMFTLMCIDMDEEDDGSDEDWDLTYEDWN